MPSHLNEIIFPAGLPQSNSDFLKWYADKQIYTSGQQLEIATPGAGLPFISSQEYVTPPGCIGYSIFIDPFAVTPGGDPRIIITFNGTPVNIPVKDDANVQTVPIYVSPCFPYVEIKDALTFENQLRTKVTISIVYYRLKYRDR
jgi:hypothetical protein|tara:strand:- start:98 stop:529 length:432 start_codon:yes stop_codon:yes gene_type:complete